MLQLKSLSVALVVVAALVGGAAGAGATWALSRPASEPSKKTAGEDSTAGDESESDDEPAALQRIERLEAELRALKRRNTSTEALQKYASRLNKGDAKARNSGDAGAEAEAELAPVLDAEDPTFELAVRTVMDRVDWEREEERRVTQSKRREERAQRQTELLAERLKLTGAQKDGVQRVLTEQMETFRKLRSGDSDTPRPATRGEWRQRVAAIRTETDQKLAGVLNDEQMSSYRQFVEEEGFGPRARRGGRSGPRDGAQDR
jgi:hypothetical protein